MGNPVSLFLEGKTVWLERLPQCGTNVNNKDRFEFNTVKAARMDLVNLENLIQAIEEIPSDSGQN
jgi:hypothetical protein